MTEQAESNQKVLVIALVVIALLLAAIVGVIVYKQSAAGEPVAPAATPAASTAGAPAGMGGTVPNQDAAFDPTTAPKVPAGTEPEAYVRQYYELCQKKEYAKAYKMLPIATQQYYGDEKGFESTLEGYGITAFDVKSGTSTDTEVQVIGTQEAQGMTFPYTWTLVKEGDTWLVKSRQMATGQ